MSDNKSKNNMKELTISESQFALYRKIAKTHADALDLLATQDPQTIIDCADFIAHCNYIIRALRDIPLTDAQCDYLAGTDNPIAYLAHIIQPDLEDLIIEIYAKLTQDAIDGLCTK